jgi:hypothetical protein
MSEKGYRLHKKNYASTLVEEFERKLEAEEEVATPTVPERTGREAEIEKNLTVQIKNWDELKPEVKAYALKNAKEYPEFPVSKLILQKVEGGSECLE